MKNIFAALLVLSVMALCFASDDCDCDPLAGCRHIGCRCLKDDVAFEPPHYPPQAARSPKCAPCPPRLCPADLVRMYCEVDQPCDEKQLRNYVRVTNTN